MKISGNTMYLTYILIGLGYIISKVVYFALSFVCIGGLIHGVVASVLTIVIAVLAFREYKRALRTLFHWLAILVPLLILPLTPIIMMNNLHEKIFEPNKISIFLIWEVLAFTQVILAISMYKTMITRKISN